MKTIEADDCLKCLLADQKWAVLTPHLTCRLEDGKSILPEGGIGMYPPDHFDPPDWCPLPVKIVPPTKEKTDDDPTD